MGTDGHYKAHAREREFRRLSGEWLRSSDRLSGTTSKVSHEQERQRLDRAWADQGKKLLRQEEGRCGEIGSERGCWHGRGERERVTWG